MDSNKKAKKSIERNFDKLSKSLRKVRTLLEQEYTITKVPPEVKKEPVVRKQYKDKESIVALFSKVTKATSRLDSIILDSSLEYVDVLQGQIGASEFVLQKIVVDLTKFLNELKKHDDISPEDKDKAEEVRRMIQYVETRNRQIRKEFDKELEKVKVFKERQNEIERRKNEEIAKLKEELGIDELKSVGRAMDDIEKNHGDVIKGIRQLIVDYADMPEKATKTAQLILTGFGATVMLYKKADPVRVTQEGIMKILTDPDLRRQLEPFMTGLNQTAETMSDSLRTDTKLPALSSYISEVKLKINEMIKDADDVKGTISEGVIKDVSVDFVNNVKKTILDVYNFVKNSVSKVNSMWKTYYKEQENFLSETNSFLDKHEKEARQNVIRARRMVSEIEADILKSREEELKKSSE